MRLLAIAFAIKLGTDKELRTLYSLGPNGEPETSGGGKLGNPGIAVYVAGVAGVITVLGGLQMRKSPLATPDEQTERCPECAETILAAAHVCKHCGAHIEDAATQTPA